MDFNKKRFIVRGILLAKAFKRHIQGIWVKISLPEFATLSIFAIFIGSAAGLVSVLFHNAIEFFNLIFFEQTTEGLFFLGSAAVIVLPAIGMFIQSIMIKLAPDIADKKGVIEVVKAVALRGGFIPFRTTLFHFLAPVICIGSGGTVGPEGPAAQLGGGISSMISQLAGLSDSRIRVFTAAGAGAAIAAIFNTPLGGVFFALEIILLNDFNAPALSALILSSVTASTISRIFLSNESMFVFNIQNDGHFGNLYLYALLGILAGIFSIIFIRYSSFTNHFFKKFYDKKIFGIKIPQWLIMTLIGMLVGVSGFYFKDIFGIGYSGINNILNAKFTWKVVIILFLLKFLLVPLILNSGGFGGVFAPSLFMGACLGFLFASGTNYFFNYQLSPTTFILVGMGAMLGGISTIPITGIMIIFEMTQNYSFILPLMLAVIVSTTISRFILKGSAHVKLLEEQGYLLSEGKERNILKSILIRDIELEKIELVPETTKLPALIDRMIKSSSSIFYTTNKQNKITGLITESEIRPVMTEYDSLKAVLVASDLAKQNISFIKPTDNLDYASRLMNKLKLDQLPVISDDKTNKNILGAITQQQILSIHNRESLKYDLVEGLSHELRTISEGNSSSVASGYSITVIKVPEKFIGKNLIELKIRTRFNLEVLMIKQAKKIFDEQEENNFNIVNDPEYRLQQDDKLVVFGSDENIKKLSSN